jgi:hypothetical protein
MTGSVAADKYFKTGESVTIEAGVNGFIVHTEEGPVLTTQIDQMVAAVVQATTNHIAIEAQQKALAAAEEQQYGNITDAE